MKMTPEQQKLASDLTPRAITIANRIRVDSGVALLALCKAVLLSKTKPLAYVYWACLKEGNRDRLRRSRERLFGSVDDLPHRNPGRRK